MSGGYGDSLQFWSYQGSWFDWGPRFILKDDGTTVLAPRGGNVGIGTASPTDSILDVEGNMHLNDYDLFLRAGVDRNHGLGWYGPGKLFAGFGFDGPVLYGFGGGGLGTVGVGGSQNVALNWNGQGNVGIGTTPQGVLDVSGAACRVVVSAPKPLLVTGTDNGGAIYFGAPGSEGNAATAAIEASWGNIWNPRVSIGVVRDGARANILMDYLGHTYIRNGSNTIVYVGGDNQVSISGSLTTSGTTTTRVLEITGGADVAEPFNVNHPDKPDPGMVVAIDRQHPGELHIADQAYDKTVAGIISGANGVNPGLTLKQKGTSADGDQPVALSGRVYCLCDASYGPIEPGDLLTSSATPGHAMAVKDHTRAQGAIIGKAMATLTEGKGLVLVLVTLQ
jgi:hypothetical protein